MTISHSLFDAIRKNDLPRVASIVTDHPKTLRERNERGTPPLTLAAYLGHEALTKLLVEAGAQIDASDASGTALMGACFKGYAGIVAYLVDTGADLEATNFTGGTALSFAAMFNQVAVVDLLLEKGADAGAKDHDGQSPADYARRNGFEELALRIENAKTTNK